MSNDDRRRTARRWLAFALFLAATIGLAAYALDTFIRPSRPGSLGARVPNFVGEISLVLGLLHHSARLGRKARSSENSSTQAQTTVRHVRGRLRREANDALSEIFRSPGAPTLTIRSADARFLRGTGFEPLQSGRVRGPTNLIRTLTSSNSRTLLLTGPDGAGKTVFMRQAQVDALGDQQPNPFFAVFLRMTDWTFTQLNLDAWIEESAVHQLGSQLYETARGEDRLIIMLDGLDEIFSTRPTELPRTPNTALNEVRRSKHFTIVACRQAAAIEILEAVDVGTWPVALLMPIDSSEANDQLIGIVDPGTAAAIIRAIDTTGEPAGSPLRQPLYFELFLEEIRDPGRRDEAIKAALSNDGLVDLLWQRFLDTAVEGRPRVDRPENAPAPHASYDKRDAYRWLKTLAQFVKNLSGTEIYSLTIPAGMILPHHLVALAPRRKTNFLTLLMTAVLWLPLFVMLLVLSVRDGQDARPYIAALAMAAVLLLAAAVMTLGLIRPIAIVPARLKDDAGLTRMTMAIAVTALVFVYALVMSSVVFASAYSLGFFIPFGLGYTCATRPTLLNSRVAAVGVSVATVLCPVAVLVFDHRSAASWLVSGVVTGVVALAAAVLHGARLAKTPDVVLPRGYIPTTDPYYRLRQDKISAGAVWVVAALLTYYVVASGSGFRLNAAQSVAVAVLAGLATGPGLVSVAWRRYLAVLLLSRRSLPFRLKPFLSWAWTAEVLHRSEGAYEFRHATLQEFVARLGETSPTPTEGA